MFTLYVLFFLILVIYAIVILLCRYSWEHHAVYQQTQEIIPVRLSVVIAFRNESSTLPACLRSIEKQKLPEENFEVILVDDHSDDGSAEFAADFCARHVNYRYFRTASGEKGKKAALITGIEAAVHDTIVLTDADCTVGEMWLETIAGFYTVYRPEMIIGLVDIMHWNGFLATFQELEFLSLIGIGAGAAAMGRPLYCSGANLVFSKKRFKEYPDPFRKNIVSGDDTLFLHRIKKSYRKRILVLKSPLAVVTTRAEESFAGFLIQRFRWASKSIHYRDTETIIMSSIVVLINLALIASTALFISGNNFWLFPFLFVIKTVADYIFMKDFIRFFGRNLSIARFVVYELIYMSYVIPAAFAGILFKFKWKGRKYP